jgi:hypothetical protein
VQESLNELNRSSVLISFWISARVLGRARRKAISQMTLWPSSPQAQASLLIGKKHHQNHHQPKIHLAPARFGGTILAQYDRLGGSHEIAGFGRCGA